MNQEIDVSKVVLKTKRLTLRSWDIKDLDDFYEYAKEDIGQMTTWLPHQNKEETSKILKKFIEDKKTFALEYENKVIGSLGIERYNEQELPEFNALKGRELGFVLSKKYWGRGLMPEAVLAVIQYLFEDVKLDFIICEHFLDNIQSCRVQEKCGFVHFKLGKCQTHYGATKDTWISVLYNINKNSY